MLLAIAVFITSLTWASGSAHDRLSTRRWPRPHLHSSEQLPPQSPTFDNGRIVVTISLRRLRIPAVIVELRSIDGNVVLAKTTSDVVGQVTFPDVRHGIRRLPG